MRSIKPWSKMPTDWIRNGTLLRFRWTQDGSAGTSALILYVVLCHYGAMQVVKGFRSPSSESAQKTANGIVINPNPSFLQVPARPLPPWGLPSSAPLPAHHQNSTEGVVANITYDEMCEITGLSRKLIANGLKKLEAEKMIMRIGTSKSGDYWLNGLEDGAQWAKLPGQALLSPAKTSFLPFSHFHLRSKHELNAMKVYLYLISVRDRMLSYSSASFETIWKKTGVSERDIPKAYSLLLTTGLLERIGRDQNENAKQHEANQYYVAGYKGFIRPA